MIKANSFGTTMATSRLSRKCLRMYESQLKRVWKCLPRSIRSHPFCRAYARYLDRVIRLHADRKQYFATFFMRNRPELRLFCQLLEGIPYGTSVKISILACSKGAEVYSLAWAIRTARPDLQLNLYALEICQEILDFASKGIYSIENFDATSTRPPQPTDCPDKVRWNTSRDQNAWILERMSDQEIEAMFDLCGSQAKIKPFLKEGITWICGNACSSSLNEMIGLQDIVVANCFLCHMKPEAAEACLRNIAKTVKPGGYLSVSGIDLDVRTGVALEMNWRPVQDLLREIHDGDDSIRRGWPLEYWGLEPLDDRRTDWRIRYASVFQVGEKAPCTCKTC